VRDGGSDNDSSDDDNNGSDNERNDNEDQGEGNDNDSGDDEKKETDPRVLLMDVSEQSRVELETIYGENESPAKGGVAASAVTPDAHSGPAVSDNTTEYQTSTSGREWGVGDGSFLIRVLQNDVWPKMKFATTKMLQQTETATLGRMIINKRFGKDKNTVDESSRVGWWSENVGQFLKKMTDKRNNSIKEMKRVFDGKCWGACIPGFFRQSA